MDSGPRLLLELEDDRTVARWRESVFASIIAHLLVIIVVLVQPSVFNSVKASLGVVEDRPKPRQQLTFLEMPPDNQAVKVKPKTNVFSDKDRLARPGVDPSPKLPPLPPAPKPAPPTEQPAEKPLLAQAQPPPLPLADQPPAPQLKLPSAPEARQPGQTQGQQGQVPMGDLRLEQPRMPVPAAGTTATPGRAIEEAMRGLARDRGAGGSVVEGIPGGSPRAPAAVGEARILTDTQGVDFDPYLRRVVADVRRNWYAVMPEIARLGKRGRVIVIFEIMRDGGVAKLYLMTSSGSEPLDRAALAGISASVPFSPLPAEFRGPMVRLQVTFLYNMFGTLQP